MKKCLFISFFVILNFFLCCYSFQLNADELDQLLQEAVDEEINDKQKTELEVQTGVSDLELMPEESVAPAVSKSKKKKAKYKKAKYNKAKYDKAKYDKAAKKKKARYNRAKYDKAKKKKAAYQKKVRATKKSRKIKNIQNEGSN